MKGIILSGGNGTRLYPLTKVTSKQLLPIYDQPMIYYPLQTLLRGGIRDILIIVAPATAGQFLHFLGSGKEYGAKFTYEVQDAPNGLPEAFKIGAQFIGNDSVTLILGDNIFEDDFSSHIASFKSGGRIFVKQVTDPSRYGVVEFDNRGKPRRLIEKPKTFVSNFANVGIYIYDARVVSITEGLTPSERGETEITDIHNWYLNRGELDVRTIEGAWFDTGTFDSWLEANNFMAEKRRHEKKIL